MTFNYKIPFCVVMLSSTLSLLMYKLNLVSLKKNYSTKNTQTIELEAIESKYNEIILLQNIKNELLNIKLLLED